MSAKADYEDPHGQALTAATWRVCLWVPACLFLCFLLVGVTAWALFGVGGFFRCAWLALTTPGGHGRDLFHCFVMAACGAFFAFVMIDVVQESWNAARHAVRDWGDARRRFNNS